MFILSLSRTIELFAGEWCCDDPVGIFIGTADPEVSCQNMGNWTKKKQTEEEYFACALGDLSTYGDVKTESGPENYSTFIKEIMRAHKQYPKMRSGIEHYLLYRGYYYDKENRSSLTRIMADGQNRELWGFFADAVEKKSCGQAKLYYQYCKHSDYLGEYITNKQPTLDEIIECQKQPSLDAYNGTIKCVNAQSDIMNKTIDLLLADQMIKKEYLYLLENHRIRYIKNAVYAKHGRVFQDQKLAGYFTRRTWYNKNSSYSDSLLTSADKQNLSIIVEYESKLKAKN